MIVQRARHFLALLTIVSALAGAGCSDGGAEPDAAPAPASSATAPAPAASTGSGASAAATPVSDVTLCKSVQQIGDELKDDLIELSSSGDDPTPARFKVILEKLESKVAAAAALAGEGTVGTAAKALGAEAGKAAQNADPAAVVSGPDFEKAGNDLTAACKTAGVNVLF